MKLGQRRGSLLALGVVVLLFMTACSSIATTGSGKPPSTTLQVLQNTVNAMKQLKTEHVAIDSTNIVNMGTPSSTSTSGVPTQSAITVKGNGDVVLPDQTSMQVSLGQTAGSQSTPGIAISEIITGQKLYIQNSKGQWFVLDMSKLKGVTGNPLSGADVTSYNNLLALAEKASFTDRGTEKLNGESLHHIVVTFGKNSLADLLKASGQSLPASQQANMDQLLKDITVSRLSLDLWIDDATSYVHRLELHMTMTFNMGAAVTPTASTKALLSNIALDSDTVIDYSKFNAPVTITAPANATPTDDLLSVFS